MIAKAPSIRTALKRITFGLGVLLPPLWAWSAIEGVLRDRAVSAILVGIGIVVVVSLWSPERDGPRRRHRSARRSGRSIGSPASTKVWRDHPHGRIVSARRF